MNTLQTNDLTPINVTAVIDDAIDSCTVKYHDNVNLELAADLRKVRAVFGGLIEAHGRLLRFVENVPTDDQLDAKLVNGDTGRNALIASRAVLGHVGGAA